MIAVHYGPIVQELNSFYFKYEIYVKVIQLTQSNDKLLKNLGSKTEIKAISRTAKIEILPFIFISTPNSLRTSSFVSFFGSGDAKAVWMTSTANNPKIRNVKDILNEAESSVMA